ncbi:hypothetical protein ARMSODRAFT_958810 [Armillaria solidipes]|uniref:Uncharacterized protein n=1 Tax=Armillaria solidipes TaxID=1076256 RepID=A0A2H3BXL1_9AGAR|nr:hypothetical protein ARMSODRAFT_958810 [Armillaria solidipes]
MHCSSLFLSVVQLARRIDPLPTSRIPLPHQCSRKPLCQRAKAPIPKDVDQLPPEDHNTIAHLVQFQDGRALPRL